MFGAVALVIGSIIAWIAADRFLEWLRERRESAWHGRGPGTTFHSTGFEDTVPPHEATDRLGPLSRRSPR